MASTSTGREAAARGFAIGGARFEAPSLAPGLHVVATPIGNLGDMTLRGIETLAAAAAIACEDTRRTATLLRHYAIATPLIAYHEHNAARQRPRLLAMLGDGAGLALVSDAGTPMVSDPGFRLALEAMEAGHAVIPVPGASAVLAALAGAGLPTDRFWFEGFLPSKSKARRDRIGEIAAIPGTLVLFEAPSRLAASLADLAEILGPRDAAVCRELTKLHETFERAPLDSLAERHAGAKVRGEIVILVAPPEKAEVTEPENLDAMLAERAARIGARTAAAEIAAETGLDRKALYKRAIALVEGRRQA
ncbi:MAG: 16S rRNA (cytidine(1402)-2'-O)-methyltransferase [Flavobacteriaceae bacterium]